MAAIDPVPASSSSASDAPADLVVVPAAGSGSRLGAGIPKAWVDFDGEPLVVATLRRLSATGLCPRIVLVSDPPDPRWGDPDELGRRGCHVVAVVPGGETRHASVRNGIESFRPAPDAIVLVHDAARPLVRAEDVRAVLAAARRTGAAVGGWPVADTMKRIDGESRIVGSVDREGLFAVATPQAFRAGRLFEAMAKGGDAAFAATDEASIVQAAGFPVAAVPVSRFLFKVTWARELEEAVLLSRLGLFSGGRPRAAEEKR
jgi:2-C-methyl-D-erythritol 4-phosphate cytidylyltransferase